MMENNKKDTVLFIDDSLMIQNIIEKFLKLRGYNVHLANNGEEGIEKFNQLNPDIVITDLKMPIMSGLEVLSYISKKSKDIPIIIVSGEGEIRDVIDALKLGAWDYITKPIEDINIIDLAIKKALSSAELIKKNRLYEKNLELLVKQRTEELENANKQLELTINAIVNSLSTITEKKDQYTAGHQQRVSLLAVYIAKEMGLPNNKINGIKIAGLLHDIGKIYVPAEILTKPAILDQYEIQIIKEHSKIGYEILRDIPFPWPIAEIVHQHHERNDGSGYPNSLLGDDILIESKIIAVADVVEAMSFHRPYRPALGIKNALNEIKEKSGSSFNSECVDACLKIYKKDSNIITNFFTQ